MSDYYEKPMWTADAQHYASTSGTFSTMALILGGLGVIGAVIMFIIALTQLGEGGFTGMIAAVALGFQSIMLIVFGSMMHLLSRVLLAVFEMSLSGVREKMYADEAEPTTDAD